MNLYNLLSLKRFERICEQEIVPNSKVYLSLPCPSFRLGLPLWDLEEFSDDKPEDLDLRRKTFVHTTLLSPRVIPSAFPIYDLAKLIDDIPRFEVSLTHIEYFEDSHLLVGKYDDDVNMKDLHNRVLSLSALPPGDPSFEGKAYTPHVTLGVSKNPERDIPYLTRELGLPLTWTACRVDVNAKRPTDKYYTEMCFLTFEGN